MAFPTNSTVLDNFNRANNTNPGTNWSLYYGDAANINIVSNAAVGDSSGGYNGSYWTPTTFGPDTEVYCLLSIGPANNVSLDLRLTGTLAFNPTGYELLAGGSSWNIYRLDSGGQTQLGATISQAISAGDSIGFSAVGTTLTAWYKSGAGSWTSLGTRTDSNHTGAGSIATEIQWSTTSIDNFSGGTVVTGGGGPTILLLNTIPNNLVRM